MDDPNVMLQAQVKEDARDTGSIQSLDFDPVLSSGDPVDELLGRCQNARHILTQWRWTVQGHVFPSETICSASSTLWFKVGDAGEDLTADGQRH